MDEGLGSVEKLQEKLYSRETSGRLRFRRRRLAPGSRSALRNWGDADKEPAPMDSSRPSRRAKGRLSPFARNFLIASLIFFCAAGGTSVYFFFGGANTVSSENIDIAVSGPLAVDGGEAFPLQVTITNRNPIALEFTDLLIEFPEGTRLAADPGEPLARYRESLETIAPNASVQKALRLMMLGGAHSEKDIAVTLEYRVAGSNAIFFKEQDYKLVIASSLVDVAVSSKNEVTAGQEIELALDVFSNAETVSNDVLLVAEYPSGFAYIGAAPEPSFATDIWRVGDIPPGGRSTIHIRGTLAGEDGEERIFRFSVGSGDRRDEKRIETVFATALHPVLIKRPFLSMSLGLNGEALSDIAIESTRTVRGDISWINNLNVPITDAEFLLTLEGDAMDKTTVVVSEGFYRSLDNTILWNRQTSPALASIAPGGEGNVSFSFSPLRLESDILANLRNPEIILNLSLRGKRLSERGVSEEITGTVSRRVKVATDLMLTSQLSYSRAPLSGSGPLPPRAEKETVYTVTWSVANTTSDITDARVSAVLPPYVRWVGATHPSGEKIVFSTLGGEVIWSAGDIPAGTGVGLPAREVSFQVALTPSVGQIGKTPIVIEEAVISGKSVFTGTTAQSARPALTIGTMSGATVPDADKVVE